MRLTFNIKKTAVVIAAAGLSLGLLGMGVGASFTDGGSATENVKVGTFAIALSSSTPGAVVAGARGAWTVTENSADILSSAAGTLPLAFTVTSTGSIPAVVNVTKGAAPVLPFTDTMAVAPADVTLSQTQKVDYSGGIAWPVLGIGDLGKSTSVTYTIKASEQAAQLAVPTLTRDVNNVVTVRLHIVTFLLNDVASPYTIQPGDKLDLRIYDPMSSGSQITPVTADASGIVSFTGVVTKNPVQVWILLASPQWNRQTSLNI